VLCAIQHVAQTLAAIRLTLSTRRDLLLESTASRDFSRQCQPSFACAATTVIRVSTIHESLDKSLQPNYSQTRNTHGIRAEAADNDHAIFRRKTTGQHPVDTAQSNS